MTEENSNYQLTVKMIGVDKSKPSLAIGVISLVSPDGEVKEFTFRSGGWGKGSLPGLNGRQFNGDGDNVTAVYDITTQEISADGVKVGKKGFAYEGNRGFKLHLENDAVKNMIGRDLFRIHPDGGVAGTLGCIGIDKSECKDFEQLWCSIPKDQRPKSLIVLKPETDLAVIMNDLEKFGRTENKNHEKYLLLNNGSKGDTVSNLQTFLKESGFAIKETDGKFGTETKEAVKEFQKKFGLKVDGIVGPETFGKIYELNNLAQGKDVKKGIRVNVDPELLAQFASSIKNSEYDIASYIPKTKKPLEIS